MNRTYIFDIDGVLNRCGAHHYHHSHPEAGTLQSMQCQVFAEILRLKPGELVLCSSWRFDILINKISMPGFQYMLKTHGIKGKLVGTTDASEGYAVEDRQRQIQQYIDNNNLTNYMVFEDMPVNFPGRHIQPESNLGLQIHHIEQAINLWNRLENDNALLSP